MIIIGPAVMIIIGPAESLKGKEKRYCRHHRGWNPPLKIALAILRDERS
jgi:hypothetical protein